MERRTESDRDMAFFGGFVCKCACVCVICAGWMRVSALLYVAKKECFSRAEINDVERGFIQKSEKKGKRRPTRRRSRNVSSMMLHDRGYTTYFYYISLFSFLTRAGLYRYRVGEFSLSLFSLFLSSLD